MKYKNNLHAIKALMKFKTMKRTRETGSLHKIILADLKYT